MVEQVVVRIIGVPTAYAEGVTEAWRKVAGQTSTQLRARFGDRASGGKVSGPAIAQYIDGHHAPEA